MSRRRVPGPPLRSQAFWGGRFRDTDPAPPPAHGPPAEEGPLFPGAPGGCEPPGKALDRNSSCGRGHSCPTPRPLQRNPAFGGPRPKAGTRDSLPARPCEESRVTAMKSPPPPPPAHSHRVVGGPEGGGKGTGVQAQRVQCLGGPSARRGLQTCRKTREAPPHHCVPLRPPGFPASTSLRKGPPGPAGGPPGPGRAGPRGTRPSWLA